MGMSDGLELSDFQLELPYELGRYRLDAEIGRGGMGAVYHAIDTMLDRPVAVKVLLPQLAADRQFVQRFMREAQMAARLEHPSIVTVHDVGNQDGLVYFVMRLAVGLPLDRLIENGLPWERAEHIALQVAEALAYAHSEGVIHRDIKPENVIVAKDGSVTITDFGLARPEQQAGGPTQAGVILGTPGYMAPEQALGKAVDHRADLYAFGVMLYELASGQLPFDGETAFSIINQHINTPAPKLSDVKPAAPPWLVTLIDRLLSKDPAKRPASMAEVCEVLRANQGSELQAAETGQVTAQSVVARVRRGELSLAAALTEFPQFADTLQEAFRREMTVVSFDLAGSTQLKQVGGGTIALGPIFNAYREMVDQTLADNHAVETVWAGDGTVAVFDTPSDAVEAAQTIVRRLAEINTKFPNVPDLGVRVGVHTGSVLRDPHQPLGQVTSTALDITGHIQKDARVGLVEASQVTVDKLAGREGWVPLRKARDSDLMVFGWHPEGPEHVPQSWVSRMRFGRGEGAEQAEAATAAATATAARAPAQKPGEAAKPTRQRQTKPPTPRQATQPDTKLYCPYCEAEVTVRDQKCPSCDRLNRHYDPAIAERGRKRPQATTPARPKPGRTTQTGRVKAGRQTFAGRAAEVHRTSGRPSTGSYGRATQQPAADPQVIAELVGGIVVSCALMLLVGYFGKGSPANGWWWEAGRAGGTHTRLVSVIAPAALLGLVAMGARATQPALAAGLCFGIPLGAALLRVLGWWV